MTERTSVAVMPVLIAVQPLPASVVLYIPTDVAAYTMFAEVGSMRSA